MRKIPKYLIVIMVVSTLLLLYFPASLAALPLVVYVDDSNTSGPWDGTQASPYKTIQDGLDNVAEEGAVYVAPGNYNETIDIDFGLSTTNVMPLILPKRLPFLNSSLISSESELSMIAGSALSPR